MTPSNDQYRDLGPDEVIQEGDEQDGNDGWWYPVDASYAGKPVPSGWAMHFRRRVEPDGGKEQFGQPQLSGVDSCVTQNCGTPHESEPHLGGNGENPDKTSYPGESSPTPPQPNQSAGGEKCVHCGKYRTYHNRETAACTIWTNKNDFGGYHPTNRFTPQPAKPDAAQEVGEPALPPSINTNDLRGLREENARLKRSAEYWRAEARILFHHLLGQADKLGQAHNYSDYVKKTNYLQLLLQAQEEKLAASEEEKRRLESALMDKYPDARALELWHKIRAENDRLQAELEKAEECNRKAVEKIDELRRTDDFYFAERTDLQTKLTTAESNLQKSEESKLEAVNILTFQRDELKSQLQQVTAERDEARRDARAWSRRWQHDVPSVPSRD